MKKDLEKAAPLRLDATRYRRLQRQILERDNWRCQACGCMQDLQVHHQQYRSQSGSDKEDNLITLCAECHTRIHHEDENRRQGD